MHFTSTQIKEFWRINLKKMCELRRKIFLKKSVIKAV